MTSNEFAISSTADTDGTANQVSESAGFGSTVGVTAFASDADGTDTVSYSLDDNAGGRFTIDAATGVVSVAGPLDYETATSHSITVRSTSTDGSFSTQSFTIDVLDANEAGVGSITDTDAAGNVVDEDATSGTVVGVTAFAEDPDGTDTVSYSLDDDAGGLFTIDAATGVVTVAGALDYETATSHNVTIRATSTDGSFATLTLAINVNDVNEFVVSSTSDSDAAANEVSESATVGTSVGLTALATDSDGTDAVSYSLDDDAGGRFTIDAATGVVSVAGPLDYESATSHSITVRSTSTDGSFSTQSFTVDVLDANESSVGAVIDTDGAANSVDEDAAAGTVVGVTAFADDPDGTDTVSYSLDDDAGGLFTIDNATGVVTVAGALDYETATSHNITIRATSTDGSFSTLTLAIGVNDINEFAVSTTTDSDGATNEVIESAGFGSTVGITALASDADGTDTVSYSLDDDAGGLFTIDAATGVVSVVGALDYETATSHTVTVRSASTDGSFSTQSFTIDVLDANEAGVGSITDTDTAGNAVDEDATSGSVVGITAFADDPDGTDVVNYSLDDDAGGLFTIDGSTGVVTVAGVLDYETATSHNITVRATSTDGSFATLTLAIGVNDTNDNTPVVDPGQSFNVNEGAATGQFVGNVTGSDADPSDTLQSWTITGGNDDGIFAIDAATGAITVADPSALDYESTTSYSLTVRVSDGTNWSATESVVINVQDANEFAVGPITDADGAANSVSEAAGIGSLVGVTASADDPDGTDTVSYSLDDDAGGLFTIDAATGVVTVAGTLDFETATSHNITIRATSSDGSSSTSSLAVSVTDSNEFGISAVSDGDGSIDAVLENSSIGSTVGITALASDADGTDTVSYSLDDDAGGLFSIDASTGVVTVSGALDYEVSSSHSITVRALSTDGSTATAVFTIAVNDENDNAPVVTPAQTFSIAEDAPDSTVIGTVAATDPDTTGTLQNWQILSGNDSGAFAIDPATGAITVSDSTQSDFESQNSYSLAVRVSDGQQDSAVEFVTITIVDAPDAPTGINLSSNSIDELLDSTGGITVGLLSTVDQDTGDSFAYTIVGGLDAAAFSIGGAGGDELLIDDGLLDFEVQSEYEVTVRVTDGSGLWFEQTITIYINDLNDTPVAGDDTLVALEDTPLMIDVSNDLLANDGDQDGDALTVSGFTQPVNGLLIDNLDGTWSYVPDLDYSGTDSFTYTVDDGRGGTATATVTINVQAQNDAPRITSDGGNDDASLNVNENDTSVTTVQSSDVDGGVPAYSIIGGADQGLFSIDSASGALSFTSAPDFEAPLDAGADNQYEVIVQVSDGAGGFDAQTINVTVVDLNDTPPVVDSGQSFTVLEDAASGTVLGTVTATDPDSSGSLQNWSIVGGNANGIFQIDPATGELTIADPSGLDFESVTSYTLDIQVSDGINLSAVVSISVSVQNVNETPVDIVIDNTAVPEGIDTTAGYPVGVLAALDPDAGDTFTYEIVGGADAALFNVGGVLSDELLLTDGVLDAETRNTYEVVVRATDAQGLWVERLVVVTVTDLNDTPIGVDDTLQTDEDTPLSFGFAELLGNDSDQDGDALTISGTTQPANGVLLDNLDGTWTYLPNENFSGDDYITYTVTDGRGGTATATVHISVIPVNDLPLFVSSAQISVSENSASPARVVAADVESGQLRYDIVGGTDAAAFGLDAATGELSFVNTPNFEAPADSDSDNVYEVLVQVSDGDGGSATQAVAVQVVDANDSPAFDNQIFGASDNAGAVVGRITAIDEDSGDTHHYQIIGGDGADLFSIDPTTGEVIQTLSNMEDGIYALQVQVVDAFGASATGTILISVDKGAGPSVPSEDPTSVSSTSSSPMAAEQGSSSAVSERVSFQNAQSDEEAESEDSSGIPTDDAEAAGRLVPSGQVRQELFDVQRDGVSDTSAQSRVPEESSGSSSRALRAELVFGDEELLAERIDLSPIVGAWNSLDLASATQFTLSNELVKALEEMRLEMDSDAKSSDDFADIVVQSGVFVSVSLTAGFVSWLLRTGSLLATFLSATPMLRQFDPIPILAPRETADEERKDS